MDHMIFILKMWSNTKEIQKQVISGITRRIVSSTYLLLFPVLSFSQVNVENLTCEFLRNPLAIETENPRLSWQLVSNQKDVVQHYYQIVVSDDVSDIMNGNGKIWDTGKIASKSSILIEYNGALLQSGQKYYWKVKIWHNKSSSPIESVIANWEMGKLDMDDWGANWISAPRVYSFKENAVKRQQAELDECTSQTEPSPYLRKKFSSEKAVKKARLYISGLGYYEAFLNSTKIGDRILEPAWTSYHKKVLYSTYDVTNFIKVGKNVLGVILGDGWFNQHSVDTWSTDQSPWRNRPCVMAQLEITYEDGSVKIIKSDGSWMAHEAPIVFSSVRQGETYDARKEIENWSSPEFNDSDWVPVWIANAPLGKLESQIMQPIKIQEEFEPYKIFNPKQDVYVLYYPQDIAGWLKVSVQEKEGQKITLKYGEAINPDGSVSNEGLGRFTFHERFQTDEYICKSNKRENWHPRFTYHGFTYVEITGLSKEPQPEDFIAQSVYTDMETYSSFSCSDEMINKIQKITIWSIKGNAHGYAEASPHREKLGWTGDAHLAAEATLYNFDSKLFYSKWIDDLALEQLQSGELPAIAPTSGWGFFWGNGPAWDNAFLLIPWYQYVHTGDLNILKEYYDGMKKYFEYVDNRSKNNISNFGLGDWSPPYSDRSDKYITPAALTSTAYFYVDAILLSKIAKILGFDEESKWYQEKSQKIKKNFNKSFFDLTTSFYASKTQTAQACALYQGLTPKENHQAVVEKLVELVNEKDNHLNTGILGTKYLLYALSDNGFEELAYEIITKKTFPGWGYFVTQGATTLWERWSGEGLGGNARNLAFFADVSAWFYKYILGIKSLEEHPGFKKFEISPYFFENLDWAKGKVSTMYGDIKVFWHRNESDIILDISIPSNTEAIIKVPEQYIITDPGSQEMQLSSGYYSLLIKNL
jgi:alpha-L-rhamnosidase